MEDFLGPAERAKLAGLAATLEGKPFMVLDRANNLTPTLDDTRVCEWVAFGESQRLIDEVVARAFEEQIIPRIGQSIDWYEQPQVLRYGPGGYYKH